MLARVLQHEVPHLTRVRGADYFRRGAVRSVSQTARGIAALVRGGADYTVRISHESGGFISSCECPYFADRLVVCKHIWAVVLSPEAERALAAAGPIQQRTWIEAVPSDAPGVPASPELWQHVLTEIERAGAAGERATPGGPRAHGEIVYVLETPGGPSPAGLPLTILSRSRRKDGEWARPRPLALSPQDAETVLGAEDREIVSLLMGADNDWTRMTAPSFYQQSPRYSMKGPLLTRLLPLLVRTGRAFVSPAGRDSTLLPLTLDEGAPWRIELTVGRVPEQGFRVEGGLVRDDERLPASDLLAALPEGFFITRTFVARLDPAGALAWLAQLQRSGPVVVPPAGAARLAAALAQSGCDPGALPAELQYEVVGCEPRPGVLIRRQPSRFGAFGRDDLDATVQFDYDGTSLDAESSPYDPERKRLVRRDPEAEARAHERLAQLGFRRAWNSHARRQTLGVPADAFPGAVRTLVQEGWRVEAEGRVFRAPRTLQVEVRSGIDWFELHGSVDFGEGRTAGLSALLAAYERGEGTVTLDDGTRGLVPEEWLQRFAGVASLGERDGDHLRYRRSQAALLDALLAAQPAVQVDEVFARARTALQTFNGIGPVDPPPSFRGQLREYQREALGWLEFLREFGFGGCLADDMGLGKTVMVLAMLERRRHGMGDVSEPHAPSLVVVPRSLVFNWKEEAGRFAPKLRVLDYTGTERSTRIVREHDLVLTTYGTLRRDAPHLSDVEFDYVILDEAQAIKNAATASAKAARLLRGRHRLALSGTPVENHVGELWSLFDFLNPGLLGTAAAFQRGTGGRTRRQADDLSLVARAVRPFILRRTKAQVAPELPERSEQTIHCELEGAQRRLYDELRERYRRTLLARIDRDGVNRSKMHVLEALLRLRQAACHAALNDERRAADTSAKFDVLLPRLAELVEEGHKALVFSQFTRFLGLLRPRLETAGISYEYLDGRTRDRAARVDRFQTDPECRVFLISLKAGGLGLNLTAAEYVFLLDPWWNPAAEAQAIDRAHRIGQTRPVFAYRLIATDTVEEKVSELQRTKRELADAILTADEGVIRNLTREDLEWLIA